MAEYSWARLLERVRADMPSLLSDFLNELRSLEGYSENTVPQEDIERTALQAFDLFLTRLDEKAGAPVTSDFPDALGRRRARQGIRIEHFTEGVRINFRLLWRALHRAALPDLVHELADNGERVLNVVERYSTEVQRAYLDEIQIMSQQHRTARERALARLFTENAATEELQAAAQTLGLDAASRFELVAFTRGDISDSLRTSQANDGVLSYEDGATLIFFRRRKDGVDWPLTRRRASGAYISHVHGVGQLAAAARLARHVHELSRKERVENMRDAFPALIHGGVHARVAGFEHELLGNWHDATSEEQARHIETLRVFLLSGSIRDAADKLFLHRNTVFKRLRAFHELTGLDVTLPRDAAIALVLLAT